jgi:hypothetical protein
MFLVDTANCLDAGSAPLERLRQLELTAAPASPTRFADTPVDHRFTARA